MLICLQYAYNICQHRTINLNVIYMLTTAFANIVPLTWMSSICLQQHLPTSYHQLECHLYAYNNVSQHRTINLNVIYMLTTTFANIVPSTWMSSICLQQHLPTSYHQLECHLYAYNNICQHRTINLNVIYMLTTTLANIVPSTWMSSICLQQPTLPCQHRTINLNVIYMLTTTFANIVPLTWMSSICLQQHLPTSYH